MNFLHLFKRKDQLIKQDYSDVVSALETLGYFKFTDAKDIPELKSEVLKSLNELNYLSTVYSDQPPYNSKDGRHFSLDGEDLFEYGGFTEHLQAMNDLFDKLNFEVEITNHIEEWDDKLGLNHSITINGRDYVIFKNCNAYGWGEAALRFAEILNEQFMLQNKEERVFLSNGGNDGQAIILTEAQFKLLDPILKGEMDRPLRVIDWCRVMQVDREKYRHQ